jgi:hypothetical protein
VLVPGSTILGPFRCSFEVGTRHIRTLAQSLISRIVSEKDDDTPVALAVEAFTNDVKDLAEPGQPPQVVICALPVEIIERVSNMRTLHPSLQRALPEAYVARVQRTGIVNAWDDSNFRKAVENTGS